MSSCTSLKCSDICRCITLESSNNSIVIAKDSCEWDLTINGNLLADITATFDDTTRELCIFDKGVAVDCVTIPDSDDQYLELNGTVLSIHKTDGTEVNSIDLAGLIPTV